MKKLRFYLNKKLDERMIEEFLDVQGGGIDFSKGIVKIHPKLRLIKSLNTPQKEKAIRVYCDAYYRTNKSAMYNKIERVQNVWRKNEQKYITITEDFFGGFRFPRGKYIAYASIINCNPRFLESKTFQFFYKKSLADAIHTIAHELLHFIFFDFVEQRLKKEIKILSQDQLWDFSEIFNVVVLKSPRYRHIVNQNFIHLYPNHRQYIRQLEKAYKNSQNAEEFIRYSTAIISAKK